MGKFTLAAAAGCALLAIALLAARGPKSSAAGIAEFTSDGKLKRPPDYRRWIYLSSGFGMSYNENAGGNGAPAFTNVFVNPTAYESFQAQGKWPDKTVFVLEVYGSTSQGSINKHGSFQKTLMGLDVEVKDEARFADRWAYFGFDSEQESASPTSPSKNECWRCHEQNAAVEHSLCSSIPNC